MYRDFREYIKPFLEHEAIRFLIVGGATVFVDLVCYFVLVSLDYDTHLSKGISFSAGTIFAYFANSNYTFQGSKGNSFIFFIFCLLYLSTLVINIVTNEIVLESMGRTNISFVFAFVIATMLSAILNFIGMKYYVFQKQKN
jgi:putative flippase GtrA